MLKCYQHVLRKGVRELMDASYLVLKSGEVFKGYASQHQKLICSGEVIFNTGMVGYPEMLTNPSNYGQIIVFSYPLIGNYGVPNSTFWESEKIQVAGIVCAELSDHGQHYNSMGTLPQWLHQEKIPVISGVDTRALIKVLRTQGMVPGYITNTVQPHNNFINASSENFVQSVTCPDVIYNGSGGKRIIIVDCGVKRSILRYLENFSIEIKRVPYDYDYSQESFDGVLISNGPGNPTQCMKTVSILKKVMKKNKPIFGICLGAQLMALASGAKTYKLAFSHRAQNHPCMDLTNKKCYLTSQNHHYGINEASLQDKWLVSFRHLNDNTVQGIMHQDKPFFAVQFHPEASPGPLDTTWLFDKFYELL